MRADFVTTPERNGSTRSSSLIPLRPHDAYVAVRFPPAHVLFHILYDEEGDTAARYGAIRERVVASVREALAAMDVHVIEMSEEPIA